MAGIDTKTRLTVLNNAKEFLSWKVDLRIHLRAKKLWTLVEGSRKRPESATTDVTSWDDDNDKALAELIPTLGPPYKAQYQTIEEAPKLWKALLDQHESKGFVNRYNIMLEISRFTITHCNNDIHSYCNGFAKLRDEQIVANGEKHQGDNFTPNQLTTFFIGGLQGIPRWEQFVLNLRQKDSLPSFEEAMSLARDEQRLHKSLGATPENAIVLSSQSRHKQHKARPRASCRLHPQSNHKDEDCFVQHPGKRPTKPTAEQNYGPRSTMIGLSVPVHALSSVNTSSQWAVDSGANEHCCNHTQPLYNVCALSPPVVIHGATGSYTCTLRGSVDLDLKLPGGGTERITLSRVLYVPDLPINLLSSNQFRAKGVFFSNQDCTFRRMKNHRPFGLAPIQNGLNILQLVEAAKCSHTLSVLAPHKDSSAPLATPPRGKSLHPRDQPSATPQSNAAFTQTDIVRTDLWHKRLGHPGLSSMRKIQAATHGLGEVRLTQLPPCEVCSLSKSQRKVSRRPQRRAEKPLERIHIDLVGHIRPESFHGHEYIVIITDDYSRYRWTFCIPVKGDAHQKVIDFITWSKLHCEPYQVTSIRIDQGTEFGIKSLQSFCASAGIDLQYSAAYTPEQNGIAEASNKVVLTKARTMMLDSGFPPSLWNEAVSYATYLANLSPSRGPSKAPRELFWKTIKDSESLLSLSHIRRFGCVSYYHKPPNQALKSEKFAARAIRGFLLGMQQDSTTNYRIWIPETGARLHTPHVTFDETQVFKDIDGPLVDDTAEKQGVSDYVSSSSTSSGGDTPPSSASSSAQVEDVPNEEANTSDESAADQHLPRGEDTVQPESSSDEETDFAPSLSPSPSLLPASRSRRDVPRPDYRRLHHGYLSVIPRGESELPHTEVLEPSSYRTALSGRQAEEWYTSMQREIHQLELQSTWELVPRLPPGRTLIKGRWVYKLKLNPDHSIKEFKSRWVAKGFMQEEGIDFFETYAATLRTGTFRTVFALVAHFGWPLYQADITGAFLHSLLQEDIYMEAPHGFYVGQICKLRKSLYGLKQAPYLWYQALAKALEELGFLCLNADHCAFTNSNRDVFVLIFVDDIQITGSNGAAIDALRTGLRTQFTLKEFAAHTFLGLQIERLSSAHRIRLHQRPYAERILHQFGFQDSKPVSTPMIEQSLLPHEGSPDKRLQKWYRKVVGSLNHLVTYTRPDMAFAISCLSRHLESPGPQHEAAAKRVLRYLRGTLDVGLTYQHQPNEPIVFGYTDSDWAGDSETRRSTLGYAFFVAGGLVSWMSKRQSIVTLSSTEAEYVALAEALREAAWLYGLLTELGFDSSSLRPMAIFEDNQSTINLTINHANSNRTKHIDVRYHYCRQEYNSGHVDLKYVPTDQQVADGFTKPLKAVKWQHFRSLLRLSSNAPSSSV